LRIDHQVSKSGRLNNGDGFGGGRIVIGAADAGLSDATNTGYIADQGNALSISENHFESMYFSVGLSARVASGLGAGIVGAFILSHSIR
jgi:hypothetical protein